jgi:hypothetical protein
MNQKGKDYVGTQDREIQFPAYLPGDAGILGCTTSNWAEQVMGALANDVRQAPNILAALVATVQFAYRTYEKNYQEAHKLTDEILPEFRQNYESARTNALIKSKTPLLSQNSDRTVARCQSSELPDVFYVSTLRVDGSTCSCRVMKTKGTPCWHHAQHCRQFSFSPWPCGFSIMSIILCAVTLNTPWNRYGSKRTSLYVAEIVSAEAFWRSGDE